MTPAHIDSGTKGLRDPQNALSFAKFSRFVQRIRRRYAAELEFLPPGLPDRAAFERCSAVLRAQGHTTSSALRITRSLVLLRLAQCDCDAQASLSEITGSMTELAQWAIEQALQETRTALEQSHGLPHTPLWAVGMGKLGGRELNVSSDIDLIFVYAEEGQTDGVQPVSHGEFFHKWVRATCQLLSDVTEHGFVFRVDLALRPHGSSGPVAISLAALEEYLQISGREWERLAWLRARVVAASDSHRGEVHSSALRETVRPFVYRRYLDYGALDALRQLHVQIREHAASRATGRPERLDDVKLSRGGIRELEFIVQLLQLVRGGQQPALRVRGTRAAIEQLVQAGHMNAQSAQQLVAAYDFLRRVEHRIQYLDDQQTHVLPQDSADLTWLAQCMGCTDTPDFLKRLAKHREFVAQEFDALLAAGAATPAQPAAAQQPWLEQLSAEQASLVERWLQHPRVSSLKQSSAQRLQRLLQRCVTWQHEGQITDAALPRFLDWLEPLLRRESYLALLVERPAVHQRLLRMLTRARWPARYLTRHPAVIDELASPTLAQERLSSTAFEADLAKRWQLLHKTGEASEEVAMAVLRQAQQAEVFRILVRDVELSVPVQETADDLSALADSVVRVALQWAWGYIKERHQGTPAVALIAYGKLGGKELGYGSDLDLVCLYDDKAEDAGAIYAKLLRKLITWLSTPTAQGTVYDVDTALRPNGNSGLLVSSMESFENYQTQRGSNTAWTWEHQAMTRARCVLGSATLAQRFDAVRQAVLCAPRERAALRDEILAMRQRVAAAHRSPADSFDVKHSAGGMVDVEFAVQYLVLLYAHAHADLLHNSGNMALLHTAERLGLLPTGLGQSAASAYAQLRQKQHSARLDERSTRFTLEEIHTERQVILRLWKTVFDLS
jgi:[glutamine synthetase] adenylyltransferase / [glutamine synthetase]-adenylyl-L-tyrosine phosphorylase